jgi:radical SAM superfamily enzyme YgiQ (UPF0313 family)
LRIVLISPKGPLYRNRGGIFKKNLRYAPITLPMLAALVPPELNAEIVLVDEGIEDVDPNIEADLIGMTTITGSANRTYELADGFRARGIPVVLGGPHPTLVPDDAQPHADAIVTGYAEQTWPQLLRDFAAGEMKSRYDQGSDFNLDDLPMPRWDLVDGRRFMTTQVYEATRGCPHSCEFCVVPAAWGRTPYQRPVEQVVEEIKQRGSKRIVFVDLNLIANLPHAMELFEALIPLKLKWFGLASVNLFRKEKLLQLMARSGCVGLLIGFESLSEASLGGMNKGFNTVDQEAGTEEGYADLTRQLHQHGISLMATWVFGNDDDTTEIFERTAKFNVRAAVDLPRYAIATPFPGTALYKRLEAEGRILTKDWDLYDGQHVVFQPKNMSAEQLEAGTRAAWQYTYRRRSMLRRLAISRTQLQTNIVANIGYRFYAHHLETHYNCDWIIGGKDESRLWRPNLTNLTRFFAPGKSST